MSEVLLKLKTEKRNNFDQNCDYAPFKGKNLKEQSDSREFKTNDFEKKLYFLNTFYT